MNENSSARNIVRASFTRVPRMLFNNLVFHRLPAEWTLAAAPAKAAGRRARS
jgi:hypothetical protein